MEPVAYGADASGLVCGFRFNAQGDAVAISADEALASVAAPGPDTAFVWLHFNLSHSAALKWLQHNLLGSTQHRMCCGRGRAFKRDVKQEPQTNKQTSNNNKRFFSKSEKNIRRCVRECRVKTSRNMEES